MNKNNKTLLCLPLIIALAIFTFISCFAIKSATPLIQYPGPEGYWLKQLIFYVIATGLMLFIYRFGNDRIYSATWIAYGILMVFLVGLVIERFAVAKFGMNIIPLVKSANGATSWYKLPGFDFQPSEFMKIVLIVTLSKVIHDHNNTYLTHTFSSDCLMLGKVLGLTLPPCILIYLQNDAGVPLIILASVVFILFVSGLQARWFVVGSIVVGLILLIGTLLFLFRHDIFAAILGGDHKLGRFYGWVNPEGTYSNQGYQLFNALMAYGTSGWLGHGFGSTIIAFPEAHTDFIFAVIAQGFGFVGGIITIGAIAYFDFVLLRIGMRTKNDQDKYFVAGIFGMLIFQQIWNIAMVLGLVPITGITIPFISYGGSSLLSYMIAMGIFLDIEKQTRIVERKNRYL